MTEPSEEEPLARRRQIAGLGLALLVLVLVALLRIPRERGEEPPPPLAQPEPAQPPAPPAVEAATPQPAVPAGAEPGPRELMVRWCPEADAPRELYVSLGYLDTARVEKIALPESCASPGPEPGSCVYKDLGQGRYLAIQGGYARSAPLRGQRSASIELSCLSACGARVVVRAEDGCADRGSFELQAGWDGANRGLLASVQWQVEVPFVLRDLPCHPSPFVQLRAEGCEPRNQTVALEEAQAQWSFELRPEGRRMVRVLDAQSEEPVVGAILAVSGRPELEPSDEQGWIGPYAQELGDSLPFLHKRGYAQYEIWNSCFDDQDVCLARMHRTEVVQVRCEDNGAPCPADTMLFMTHNSGRARARKCLRLDERSWSCGAIEEDKARACAGRRCSDSEPLVADGRDTVYLPPFKGAICLQWPPEALGPCTLSFGEVRDASMLPCESCGAYPASSAVPVPVPLDPGSIAQVTLHCAESAWSGEAVVDLADRAICEEVPLQPLGVICAAGLGACHGHSKRAELRLYTDFNGCSEPIPAGPWSVSCENLWYETELEPGGTADIQGEGWTMEEWLAR